jgi:probable HAF family extracellular repeat protein
MKNTAYILMALALQSPCLAASFQGLGDLAGSNFLSVATGVSANGTVVVGYSNATNGLQAFRWTAETGLVGLGELPGGAYASFASAVSADGATVVGGSSVAAGDQAFRWTHGTGMIGLGDLPGGSFFSYATGVSGDGKVVAGYSVSALSGTRSEAFRWTTTNGMSALGDLGGGAFNSRAWGISADGSTIIGESTSANSGNNLEAFRWTAAAGMVGLGDLPGGTFHSIAYATSADGSVITGYSLPSSGVHEAFRWTSATGMQPLGFLPCDTFSIARAVSGNGSVIVGDPQLIRGGCAFVWDSQHGMRDFQQVLTRDYGLDLTGWRLDSPSAVSHDGTVIVGYGINPAGNTEAWVADLSPSRLEFAHVGSSLVVSWKTNGPKFILEQVSSLSFNNWSNSSAPVFRAGDSFVVTNFITPDSRLFRLKIP